MPSSLRDYFYEGLIESPLTSSNNYHLELISKTSELVVNYQRNRSPSVLIGLLQVPWFVPNLKKNPKGVPEI